MTTATDTHGRFARLSALLEQDPANVSLLADTAEAAFAENEFESSSALVDRCRAIAPLTSKLRHLASLIAMRREEWSEAADGFQSLIDEGMDAAPVRFNLAWSLAMAKRFEEALPFLDELTSEALPQAAQLEVQMLHELGRFEAAGDRARVLIKLHPDHRGLNAAVSTLALDIEDGELALHTAQRAGDHPDALITLGVLSLGEDRTDVAEQLFDSALARNPAAPRAWIGRGLTRLLIGDKLTAAREIDRGAEIFGDHLGSWIASGWAYFVAGDSVTARERFEKALALDDTFAESQGSVAVMELLEGHVEEARRRTEVALRLDRNSFSAALASMLFAAGEGDKGKAQRILERALTTPIGTDGRTVGQSLVRLGVR